MIVKKCRKCGKLVWFWQDHGEVVGMTKGGKKISVLLCSGCAIRLALKAAVATAYMENEDD